MSILIDKLLFWNKIINSGESDLTSEFDWKGRKQKTNKIICKNKQTKIQQNEQVKSETTQNGEKKQQHNHC